MEEKISIIVPVYNVQVYLKKCVDSILQQSYKNLEIILVDDGSTDASGSICDELEKQDARIKVIHKANGGLSDARNAGMKIATGNYIGFVDSDDYIASDMYEQLMSKIKKYNADIVISNLQKVYDNTLVKELKQPAEIIEKQFSKEEAIKLLFEDKEVNNYAWNKLYRRELFQNVEYPFGMKMEDIGTTYKVFEKANTIVYTNYIGYYYYQRNNSILNSVDVKFVRDLKDMINYRHTYIVEKYPEMRESAIIYKLKYIRYYFTYLAKMKQKEWLQAEEFKKEYTFFKEHYKLYKKQMCQGKMKDLLLNTIFYYGLPIYIQIYKMKG